MSEYDCYIKLESCEGDTLETQDVTEVKFEVGAVVAVVGIPTDPKKKKASSKISLEKSKLNAEKLTERKRKRREYDKQSRQRKKDARDERSERKHAVPEKETPEQEIEKNAKETSEQKKKRLERKRISEKERLRRMAELFPEKWEARLERRRIKERERREKIISAKTPEELAKMEKIKYQRRCLKFATLTPEAQEEQRAKKRFRKIEKLAKMTDDELRDCKMRNFLSRHAWVSKNKKTCRNLSEEEKEKSRRRHKVWTRNLTEEKKKRHLESVNRAQKKWLAKIKEENNEKWTKHQKRVKEYWKRKIKEETPEERLQRHHKYKVNAAARKLKQHLVSQQVGVAKIERKVVDLKSKMWKEFDPEYDKRPPKRRGRKRKVSPPPKNGSVGGEAEDCDRISLVSSVCSKKVDVKFGVVNSNDCGVIKKIDTDFISVSENGLRAANEIFDLDAHYSPCASPQLPSPSPEQSSSTRSNFDAAESTVPNFQCLHCPSVFCSDELLRTHVCAVHPDKCWKCPKCQEVVLSPLELSQHYKSSHKVIKIQQSTKLNEVQPLHPYLFICMRCSVSSESPQRSSFKTRLDLFSHVETEHSLDYWPCHFCNLLKYSKKSLKLHQNFCYQLRNKRNKAKIYMLI